MKQYLDFMRHARDTGTVKTDRTGTGTTSVFGYQMRFDLSKGLPICSTKKIHLKSIIHELIWFLAGDTNVKYLQDSGVKIWDDWADPQGELGPVYGGQWRRWKDYKHFTTKPSDVAVEKLEKEGYSQLGEFNPMHGYAGEVWYKEIDQISDVMAQLKNSPDSRRMIVSAWNVGDISQMKLPPCHALFQFYVVDMTNNERLNWIHQQDPADLQMDLRGFAADTLKKKIDARGNVPHQRLSCQLYQRSADGFLGVPFNITSYAILTHMFAQQLNMAVGDFIWTGGDCHLYSNHMEQVELQLSREPRPLPQLVIKRKPDSIFDYKFDDFDIIGYDPHPAIKAPVAV